MKYGTLNAVPFYFRYFTLNFNQIICVYKLSRFLCLCKVTKG